MKKAVLIMAGGKGERLWPLSRTDKPKQFLSIIENKSLIELAVERSKKLTDEENIFIITGETYRKSFDKYLPSFKKENIIFEPIGKDTAPAIALGAYTVNKKIGLSSLAILPADPVIKDEEIFNNSLNAAFDSAFNKNTVITIGIKPIRAETGYGYIKTKDLIEKINNVNIYKIDAFKEKPDAEKAKVFFESGDYLWNSGMFIVRTDTLLEKIKSFIPETYQKVETVFNNIENKNAKKAREVFKSIEKKSFDYAVMEKINDALCIKGEFFWDDLGAFSSLSRINEKDKNGNVIIGQALAHDANNNIIVGDNKNFIAISGLDNITVAVSNKAILIYPNGEDDRIKKVLSEMRENKADEKYL